MKMNIPIVYKAMNRISVSETLTMNYEGDYTVSSRFEITALACRYVHTAHDQSFLQRNA
jgi:hypothetical protein